MPPGQSGGGIFSAEVPLPNDSSLWKANTEPASSHPYPCGLTTGAKGAGFSLVGGSQSTSTALPHASARTHDAVLRTSEPSPSISEIRLRKKQQWIGLELTYSLGLQFPHLGNGPDQYEQTT